MNNPTFTAAVATIATLLCACSDSGSGASASGCTGGDCPAGGESGAATATATGSSAGMGGPTRTAGSGAGGSTGGNGASAGGSEVGGSGVSGTPGTGGGGTAGGPSVSCTTPPEGTCAAPAVRITEVDLGMPVIGNGFEGDTQPIPLAIAPMPGGGSRVAWLGSFTKDGSSTMNQVHVATLDCNDQLVGTPFTIDAYDFTDIALDEDGGVMMLTRDAEGSGTEHCGDIQNLCFLPDDRPGCYDMYLVRFDNAGKELWEAKLTSSSANQPPYTAEGGWNHFIWWYQHRGRIAYDGTNYAAYFCDAITVENGSCVDIHQGDRMKVVDPSGTVLTGHDSFDGGCSHSWNVRMVWDPRVSHFIMVCATDNPAPGEHRIARPNPYRTVWPSPGPDGSLSMGDLVMATSGGYWITASAGGELHLLHFDDELYDQDISLASADFSHLVSYGQDHMIAAWESGGGMTAEVRDAATGARIGEPFTIDVEDHRYVSFEAFPDGSVAYPAQGPNDHTIRIARVMPCSG